VDRITDAPSPRLAAATSHFSQLQDVAAYRCPPSSIHSASAGSTCPPEEHVKLGNLVVATATPAANTTHRPHVQPELPATSSGRRARLRTIAMPATMTGALTNSASPPYAGDTRHPVVHRTVATAAIVNAIPATSRHPAVVYPAIRPDREIGSGLDICRSATRGACLPRSIRSILARAEQDEIGIRRYVIGAVPAPSAIAVDERCRRLDGLRLAQGRRP
jgi:hypothetical protein